MNRNALTAVVIAASLTLIACGEEGGTTTVIREAPAQASTQTTTVTEKASDTQTKAVSDPAPAPESASSGSIPDVVGERLDIARRQIRNVGMSARVSGGGLFGVVVEKNWVVCAQEPVGGSEAEIGEKVDVNVDRSC